MLDTNIQVKTDHFDGPLGLLLLLVQKEEMNVRELNLTEITKQYLGYLAQMRDLNFDVAGDYLYLAATLLLIKSKDCVTEEELTTLGDGSRELQITSQAELIRRLEELQHFQRMGAKLWGLPKKGHDIFVKPKINRKAIINSILTPIELEMLSSAMMDFIRKEKRKYTVIKRDRLSIKEKLVFLKENLKEGESTDLDSILEIEGAGNLDDTVITFISLLELARLKRISIFQNEDRGKVYVNVVKSLDDFDVNGANGFEEEDALEEQAQKELDAELEKSINESMQAETAEASDKIPVDFEEVKPAQITHEENAQPEVSTKLQ